MYLLFRNFFFISFSIIFVSPVFAYNPEKINIFVSIPPQKFLVEQVGGDRVTVNIMVKPGSNPESYEPTPKQMAALNKSHFYFRVGVPFESAWIDKIKHADTQLRIISCCQELFINDDHTHELDAHIWTSPENAKKLATVIKETLIKHDPDNKSFYEEKHKALTGKLDQLHDDIQKQLSKLNNRYFIVSHPSWGHFARSYNLKQLSIEQDGGEIRAKELSGLVEFAKSENIKTVYIQKQVNNASARVLAKEINARLDELDPLAENYIENMRLVADRIAQGAE